MTTWARDFKSAGTVGRIQLVMVALTQNQLSVRYAWFVIESHIIIRLSITSKKACNYEDNTVDPLPTQRISLPIETS